VLFSALPKAQGLYDPENEADSCGVAMVTDIKGRRSHSIVADGLTALEHLEHRRMSPPARQSANASSRSRPKRAWKCLAGAKFRSIPTAQASA
jgi:hypothetical protein